MEDFLAVAGGTRTLPKPLPWWDWSEPPEAMLDSTGAKTYPDAIARRAPEPWEIEPESPAGMDPDGVPSDPAGGMPGCAVYLPLHERFNLVAFDVVCQAPGWPRLARGRVLGAGALIRRLVRATAEERWEDWVALDDKHGAWLRLLDDRMGPPTAPPAPRAQVQVDPAALPVADLTRARRRPSAPAGCRGATPERGPDQPAADTNPPGRGPGGPTLHPVRLSPGLQRGARTGHRAPVPAVRDPHRRRLGGPDQLSAERFVRPGPGPGPGRRRTCAPCSTTGSCPAVPPRES